MSFLKDLSGKAIKSVDSIFQPKSQQPTYVTPFESKTRFTMIGPVGSGKTTVAANLLRTAYTRSQRDPDFYCDVQEFGSEIREAVARLCDGHFPPKTEPTGEYAYESGLTISKTGWFGEKKLHIPLIDVAGEDQQLMLQKFASPLEVRRPVNYLTAKTLLDYMKSSKGFILTLCAPRVRIPGQTIDEEPKGISRYPDVNMARMLDDVFAFKKGKIEAILVIITKWDMIAPHLIEKGIDLYNTTADMTRFMNNYFPGTKMALKKMEDKGLVKYYPSYVSLKKDEKGEVEYWRPNDPKVETITEDKQGYAMVNYRYAESSYYAMFDQLESYAR